MMIEEIDMKYTIVAPKRPESGDYKTGSLEHITVEEISKILDMTPNVEDDPDKVVNSWGFNALPDDDNPGWYRCAIWDYRGSHHLGKFSTYGEPDVFKSLFGDRYVEMYP
tara:strand:- start:1118 stop:1447 length:330 start_codon:yes stop_codon:yes gene_type:complete